MGGWVGGWVCYLYDHLGENGGGVGRVKSEIREKLVEAGEAFTHLMTGDDLLSGWMGWVEGNEAVRTRCCG